MLRIVRTRTLRENDARIVELHDRAAHAQAQLEDARAELRRLKTGGAPNPTVSH